jgi:hypothetical protein
MRRPRNIAQEIHWMEALRRGVEYAAVIALAILSGYWIVQGRW